MNILCLVLATVLLLGTGTFALKKVHKKYQVYISHPGNSANTLRPLTLVEEKIHGDFLSQFYMDVVSVYCSESVCKIDTVRLFWNNIGQYIRYQLPPFINLEKAQGQEFSDKEYARLQVILKDENSPFANLSINEIVATNDVEHGLEVDGYSGATIIDLDESKSVKGAALTCYTLWHWANGAVRDSIRKITGEALNVEQLQTLLNGANDEYKIFALEQLVAKKAYDPISVKAVLAKQIENRNTWGQLQINYFEAAPATIYFAGLQRLLQMGDKQQRIRVLQSLTKTNKVADQKYYNDLSKYLSHLKSYREVDLFVSLLENKNVCSLKVIESMLPLLAENILIARRAYWFLFYQKLDSHQQKVLDVFYEKNEENL